VEFDPFLYVAFAAGFLVGRWLKIPGPWPGRATIVSVVVLVGLLGGSLSGVPLAYLLSTLPIALAFAALVLLATGAAYLLLAGKSGTTRASSTESTSRDRFPLPVLILGTLVVGYLVGRVVAEPFGAAIPWALCVLLALVAFGLRWDSSKIPRAWLPIASASIGAVGAGLLASALFSIRWSLALGTSLAWGWYTLAGPLAGERFGPAAGLFAFLANFLREDLTMLLAPILGRRFRGEGIAALGGATAMDTTLYFVTRYGDPEAGGIALASGLVLTLAASLLLPAVLAP
jgi:uncharacterized membrane protein YbjE (DUF340 family)